MQFPLVEHIVWLVISYGVKYTTALYKKIPNLGCLGCEISLPTSNNVKPDKFLKYKKTKGKKNKNELKDEI